MYLSLFAVLLTGTTYTLPQMPKVRGLILFGVLLRLAGKEGQGTMICSVMEACKVRLHLLLEQGLLSCKILSVPASGTFYLQSN
jgi:hypothetical protein